MSEYPEWRKKQCVHCAAGMPMSLSDGLHWTGNRNPPRCTAMTAKEHIAATDAQLADLERRLDSLTEERDSILDALPASATCKHEETGESLVGNIRDLLSERDRLRVQLAEAERTTAGRCAEIAASYIDWDKRKHGTLVRTTPVAAFISGNIRREFGLVAPLEAVENAMKERT